MLRTLIQPESRLVKLCQAREWEKVIQLVTSSPKEAIPSSSAYRGISITSLMVAIRNTAPLRVIKALVDANCDQLMKVRHHRHGNSLHEAIKYKSSIEIVIYLIEKIVDSEKESSWIIRGELRPVHIECQQHNMVATNQKLMQDSSPNKLHMHCTLFNQNDSLGRTPLHCLVDRFSKERSPSTDFMKALKLLITAFPPAVGKVDSEGLTPLDMSLITPQSTPNSLRGMEIEIKIFSLVKIMTDIFPSAAAPRINAAQAPLLKGTHDVIEFNVRQLLVSMNNMHGAISHNTLSRALMHGRHLSTIELLIGASKTPDPSWYTGQLQDWEEYDDESEHDQYQGENESCMAIVSKEFEIPLHIAVTMKAETEVIARLVEAKPESSTILDKHLLSPICWTWIRFVMDEIQSRGTDPGNEFTASRRSVVKASRRRFIPSTFMTVYDEVTEKALEEAKEIINNFSSAIAIQKVSKSVEKRSLWSNILNLLPNAARFISSHDKEKRLFGSLSALKKGDIEWGPIHAAAYFDCPKGLLLSAIKNIPHGVKEVDQYGNLPLHYAAARKGYSKSIPIGPNGNLKDLSEDSNVFELVEFFPGGTMVKNSVGQLPLHIAIEEEKKLCSSEREKQRLKTRLFKASMGIEGNKRHRISTSNANLENSPLLCLVMADIDSLEQRDSVTNLYPFMQMAARSDNFACLDLVGVTLI